MTHVPSLLTAEFFVASDRNPAYRTREPFAIEREAEALLQHLWAARVQPRLGSLTVPEQLASLADYMQDHRMAAELALLLAPTGRTMDDFASPLDYALALRSTVDRIVANALVHHLREAEAEASDFEGALAESERTVPWWVAHAKD